MRIPVLAILATAGAFVVPGVASAHVDVLPEKVVAGEPTQFTVRVPNERRGVATTAVRVEFPEGMTVYSFEPPPPGWTMQTTSAKDGRITGVTYKGNLPQERYQDFAFMGTAFGETSGWWKAHQTYADGNVKPWITDPAKEEGRVETGPTDPGPGSPFEVLPEGSVPSAAAGVGAATSTESSRANLWLSVAGIGVGALALLAAGFLWTTRPMRFPDDEA